MVSGKFHAGHVARKGFHDNGKALGSRGWELRTKLNGRLDLNRVWHGEPFPN